MFSIEQLYYKVSLGGHLSGQKRIAANLNCPHFPDVLIPYIYKIISQFIGFDLYFIFLLFSNGYEFASVHRASVHKVQKGQVFCFIVQQLHQCPDQK